jgi:hypothetical protein
MYPDKEQMKKVYITAVLIILCVGSAFSITKKLNYTKIDWITGKAVSQAEANLELSDEGEVRDSLSGETVSLNHARLLSYKKAKEKAMENMMTLLKTVRVDSDNYLSDIIEKNEFSQSRIYDVIASKAKLKEFPGGFSKTACSMELKISDIIHVIPYRYPAQRFPERMDIPIETEYTGLIVDARGISVEPMIFPSVLNEDGLEIYGRYLVNINSAGKNGIVAYTYNEQEAMKHKKAGAKPYYSVAVKSLNGSPVISDRDIRKIYSSAENLKKLKNCGVIFIIDRK